jgi:hypothetical protein
MNESVQRSRIAQEVDPHEVAHNPQSCRRSGRRFARMSWTHLDLPTAVCRLQRGCPFHDVRSPTHPNRRHSMCRIGCEDCAVRNPKLIQRGTFGSLLADWTAVRRQVITSAEGQEDSCPFHSNGTAGNSDRCASDRRRGRCTSTYSPCALVNLDGIAGADDVHGALRGEDYRVTAGGSG